jgi:hypothetical protein
MKQVSFFIIWIFSGAAYAQTSTPQDVVARVVARSAVSLELC